MSFNSKHFLSWVNRHNWGHLEKDKDIIIRHLRTYFGDKETLEALQRPAHALPENLILSPLPNAVDDGGNALRLGLSGGTAHATPALRDDIPATFKKCEGCAFDRSSGRDCLGCSWFYPCRFTPKAATKET